MDNKEFNEMNHSRDTGGNIIYDVHCPYCLKNTHLTENQQWTMKSITRTLLPH